MASQLWGARRDGNNEAGPREPGPRGERVHRYLEAAVVVAALATIPLTWAHMQQWEGAGWVALDWAIWSTFVVEYAYAMAASRQRLRTMRQHWLSGAIIILSFPLLPQLLAASRFARLVRPVRLVGGLRIARPFQLARLWAVRSLGMRRAADNVDGETRERAVAVVREATPDELERALPGEQRRPREEVRRP